MPQFKMATKTTSHALTFSHNFEMQSPKMAREYCMKITQSQWSVVPWFMEMVLLQNFETISDAGRTEPNWQPIYEYTVDQQMPIIKEHVAG